ncbi:metal-sulfur cluster assembly factor [Actinoplanes sp. GCM10030250]|uniref:metal-sulfur cluster assembly factor n=1 Tax=Actinoplanes sp. GCM10030250 TaxID=3273376 RepID=UPI003612497E
MDPAASADPAASSDAASGGAADAGAVKRPKATDADVEEAMKDVVDPELGINVVDLGLVYGTHVDDDNVVTLDMTLTSAACPLTDVIEDQTRQALTTGPGGGLVQDFRINWVWLPPWGPDKITDDGREQLRALGFNV